MSAKAALARELNFPVAVRDVELIRNHSFTIEAFELCTMCGARFGIGYPNRADEHRDFTESEDLPKKLTEILAKDHRQNREHKRFIELDL